MSIDRELDQALLTCFDWFSWFGNGRCLATWPHYRTW